MKTNFIKSGKFYKGNIHCHSTFSDGRKTPQEAKETYKEAGYDFLAITDHNVYGNYKELNEKDFLMLPGIEMCHGFNHVVGIGDGDCALAHHQNTNCEKENAVTLQGIIDYLNDKGLSAVIAHPLWSLHTLEELLTLKNYLGMEIINHLCNRHWNNGEGATYFEQLYRNGISTFNFGTDDNHFNCENSIGAYIMVKSKDLTAQSIMTSIKQGSFYSSNGPEIYDFYIDNGKVFLTCSEVESVYFSSNGLFKNKSIYNPSGITSAEWEYSDPAFITACIIDKNGKRAFTQPLKP